MALNFAVVHSCWKVHELVEIWYRSKSSIWNTCWTSMCHSSPWTRRTSSPTASRRTRILKESKPLSAASTWKTCWQLTYIQVKIKMNNWPVELSARTLQTSGEDIPVSISIQNIQRWEHLLLLPLPDGFLQVFLVSTKSKYGAVHTKFVVLICDWNTNDNNNVKNDEENVAYSK